MKRPCDICGRLEDEYWMEKIPTGKRTQYVCSECMKLGGRQADYVTKRIVKLTNSKRNKRQ